LFLERRGADHLANPVEPVLAVSGGGGGGLECRDDDGALTERSPPHNNRIKRTAFSLSLSVHSIVLLNAN